MVQVGNTREQRELAKEKDKSLFVAGFDGKGGKSKMSGMMDHEMATLSCRAMIYAYLGKIPPDDFRKFLDKYDEVNQ